MHGYYPTAVKTVLIVKPGLEELANEVFRGTGVTIAKAAGGRDLGAAVGSLAFRRKYAGDKVGS